MVDNYHQDVAIYSCAIALENVAQLAVAPTLRSKGQRLTVSLRSIFPSQLLSLSSSKPRVGNMQDYLIVGAGVFGLSTALELAKSQPDAKVTLIDRSPCPHPSAASSDLNKIIRADYDDVFYMRLALEALEKWKTDPIYRPYFHETGMLFAEDIGMGDASLKNYKAIGHDAGAEILTTDEALDRFPIFKKANWTDVKDNYYNPHSGWAEADPTMRSVAEAALAAGVKFSQDSVERLIFDSAGACVGVRALDGQETRAGTTLLCAGAWTAQLIADSAPDNKDIQANDRMVAAAAISCVVNCAAEYLSLYQDGPVHFLGMYHTHGKWDFKIAWGKKVRSTESQ